MIKVNNPLIMSIAERLEVKPTVDTTDPLFPRTWFSYDDLFLALVNRIEDLEERVTNMELGI